MNRGRRVTGYRRRGNRRGFTFVELMTVIIILGLLSGIAILKYLDLRNSARAAEVAGDFRAVLVAAYNYYSDHNDWPPDGSAGVVPPALIQYLPASFRFDKAEYTLDFDNMSTGGPNPVVGVTLSTPDADLMSKLKRTLGTKQPYFQAGSTLTYLISGADGSA
jgi:prepilin-type N-terminal cleavage/methylation domain-containing protein